MFCKKYCANQFLCRTIVQNFLIKSFFIASVGGYDLWLQFYCNCHYYHFDFFTYPKNVCGVGVLNNNRFFEVTKHVCCKKKNEGKETPPHPYGPLMLHVCFVHLHFLYILLNLNNPRITYIIAIFNALFSKSSVPKKNL